MGPMRNLPDPGFRARAAYSHPHAHLALRSPAPGRAPKAYARLGAKKRIHKLGVVLADTHYQGLQYGRDFDNMDELPLVEEWAEVAEDTIHSDYEQVPFEFPGGWDVDSRVCLKAASPRPCTVMAAVIDMEANAK